jgi:hypothetical protein
MKEFNIVFHGMILFVERGGECLLLIPEIKEHDYRFGDPTVTNKPPNLWPGDYQVFGIAPRPKHDRFKQHKDKYLVLKKSAASPIQQLERISISLPLPDAIIPFRRVKPDKNRFGRNGPVDIFNGTPKKIAVGPPKNVHDVIVFNYRNVNASDVSLRASDGTVVANGLATLCVYAQTGFDDAVLDIAAINDGDPPPSGPHRTGINDLLHYASGSQIAHPTFELSRIGTAQSAPQKPGHGLSNKHLLNLRELGGPLTDESGCVGAAISGV